MYRFRTTYRAIVRYWDSVLDFYGQPNIFWAICFELSHKCRKFIIVSYLRPGTGTVEDIDGLNFGPHHYCTLAHLWESNCTLVHFFVLWPTFQKRASRWSKTVP